MRVTRRDKSKHLNRARKVYIEKGKKTKANKMPRWVDYV